MQTLGIDLSTDPKKVWACEIDWGASPPCVVSLEQFSALPDPLGAPTASGESPRIRTEASLIAGLVDRIRRFDPGSGRVVGIDAPLGWPSAFVEAVNDWDDGDLQGFRKRSDLRLRATDRFVQALVGVTPMSVSTDRMGSTAMLLAEVLSRTAAKLDRGGFARASASDGIAEVHPTAALRSWSHTDGERFDTTSYRSGARYGSSPREQLLIDLVRCGIEVTPGFGQALLDSPDAMDAFLCALVARAVVLEGTFAVSGQVGLEDIVPKASAGPRGESIEQTTARLDLARAVLDEATRTADSEGWIHLPRRSDLSAALGLLPGTAQWVPTPTPADAFDPFARWSNGDGRVNAADPDGYGPVVRFVGDGEFTVDPPDHRDELLIAPSGDGAGPRSGEAPQ